MPVFRFSAAATFASAACLSFLFTASAAHAQIVTNGSFETGNFTGTNPQGAANTTQLFVGNTNITGWTVIGGSDISWQGQPNPYNITASDGVRSLDLTGYQDRAPYGGVSQVLSLTQGSTYQLIFDIGSNSTYSSVNSVRAQVGSLDQLFTFTPTAGGAVQQWSTFSANFNAASAALTLQLTGSSSGSPGQYIGLDNVRVTLVSAAAAPEPGSLALLGVGLAPLTGVIARRRRAAKATA